MLHKQEIQKEGMIGSLQTKIELEAIKGVNIKDFVLYPQKTEITINGKKANSYIGIINFSNLNENNDSFQESSTKEDYLIAYAKNPITGGYFVQFASMNETTGKNYVVGNYYKLKENDSPSLFKVGKDAYLVNGESLNEKVENNVYITYESSNSHCGYDLVISNDDGEIKRISACDEGATQTGSIDFPLNLMTPDSTEIWDTYNYEDDDLYPMTLTFNRNIYSGYPDIYEFLTNGSKSDDFASKTSTFHYTPKNGIDKLVQGNVCGNGYHIPTSEEYDELLQSINSFGLNSILMSKVKSWLTNINNGLTASENTKLAELANNFFIQDGNNIGIYVSNENFKNIFGVPNIMTDGMPMTIYIIKDSDTLFLLWNINDFFTDEEISYELGPEYVGKNILLTGKIRITGFGGSFSLFIDDILLLRCFKDY